jgi:hypothetical protein
MDDFSERKTLRALIIGIFLSNVSLNHQKRPVSSRRTEIWVILLLCFSRSADSSAAALRDYSRG